MKISIVKLDGPEPCGDWHDKPLRWKVVGPELEIQKFSTKKSAALYVRLRRKAKSQGEAIFAFVDHE
jgi:hypothetical protein